MNEALLALQQIDTQIDQLNHRSTALPEMVVAQEHRQQLRAWEAEQHRMEARTAELENLVQSAEQQAAELDLHKLRLSAQLKTVIAPREAEALQSEMKTLSDRRDAIDDQELESMEEMSDLEIKMAEHALSEAPMREAVAAGDAALGHAQSGISGDLESLGLRRESVRAEIPVEILAKYDHVRAHLGVAVARLVGRRCEGCHIDLSPVEVDLVKAVPVDELAECPQCTRILVR
jgi:predicted  nucleic acid-binding Zn-ribbon protein